jgi:hypothetical protein
MLIQYTKHVIADGHFWLSWAGKTLLHPVFFAVMTNIKAQDHMQQLRSSLEKEFPDIELSYELLETVSA